MAARSEVFQLVMAAAKGRHTGLVPLSVPTYQIRALCTDSTATVSQAYATRIGPAAGREDRFPTAWCDASLVDTRITRPTSRVIRQYGVPRAREETLCHDRAPANR
ncbi:hypothetical protein BIV23_07890 [Streptomyces monashensis]|uniref:Uncharacterized protein n=1 Tax=Streptomyces monashensis TaxID=1678012 RepID=A0A1S2QLH5_9ACTN|nr:hypothetical protein BIV23_07890 [Streptomyces monashensis]